MEILIQPVGKVENRTLLRLEDHLEKIFGIKCSISKEILELPEEAYNPARNQYYSTGILSLMMNTIKSDSNRVVKIENFDTANTSCLHVIGVTEEDLYVPGLNFVFGEAECPGNFAVISLYRLKHENEDLFFERILKEAVHELGHTFGLPHCENHLCVMHFSNSIVETDIKGAGFCRECLKKLESVL